MYISLIICDGSGSLDLSLKYFVNPWETYADLLARINKFRDPDHLVTRLLTEDGDELSLIRRISPVCYTPK